MKSILITALSLLGAIAQAQQVVSSPRLENLNRSLVDQKNIRPQKDASAQNRFTKVMRFSSGTEGVGGGDPNAIEFLEIGGKISQWLNSGNLKSVSAKDFDSALDGLRKSLDNPKLNVRLRFQEETVICLGVQKMGCTTPDGVVINRNDWRLSKDKERYELVALEIFQIMNLSGRYSLAQTIGQNTNEISQQKNTNSKSWPQLGLHELYAFLESARQTGDLSNNCDYEFKYDPNLEKMKVLLKNKDGAVWDWQGDTFERPFTVEVSGRPEYTREYTVVVFERIDTPAVGQIRKYFGVFLNSDGSIYQVSIGNQIYQFDLSTKAMSWKYINLFKLPSGNILTDNACFDGEDYH